MRHALWLGGSNACGRAVLVQMVSREKCEELQAQLPSHPGEKADDEELQEYAEAVSAGYREIFKHFIKAATLRPMTSYTYKIKGREKKVTQPRQLKAEDWHPLTYEDLAGVGKKKSELAYETLFSGPDGEGGAAEDSMFMRAWRELHQPDYEAIEAVTGKFLTPVAESGD